MGAIPIEFYIDDLMAYLSRNYYVGLFSAAIFHGAAHQQPQEYFVISEAPEPLTIKHEHIIISFPEKNIFQFMILNNSIRLTRVLNVFSNHKISFNVPEKKL